MPEPIVRRVGLERQPEVGFEELERTLARLLEAVEVHRRLGPPSGSVMERRVPRGRALPSRLTFDPAWPGLGHLTVVVLLGPLPTPPTAQDATAACGFATLEAGGGRR